MPTTTTTDLPLSGHKLFVSLDSLRDEVARLGLPIRLEPEIREALTPLRIAGRTVGNRFVIQPMEGCDGEPDGTPGELTLRRWTRFGDGGAKLIWGEAMAVSPGGRANPRQLMLTPGVAKLIAAARAAHRAAWRTDDDLLIGVQLTHSGRYAIDPAAPPPDDVLIEQYVRAAESAREYGADFVDVKQCHGYLLSERPGLARTIIEHMPRDILVATRIGGDAIQALDHLCMVNVTAGNPYVNPHVGRPADRPAADGYPAPEHPLVGVARHFGLTARVARDFPGLPVVGTGYSYLRQFAAMAGEANIRDGRTTLVGFGRGAIAYPDFVRDIVETGAMDPRKTCLTVSHCTNLMRSKNNELGQFAAGCVPRDPVYARLLQEARR